MAKCNRCEKELFPDNQVEDLRGDEYFIITFFDKDRNEPVDWEVCPSCEAEFIKWLERK